MSQMSLYVNDSGKCVTHYKGFSLLAGIAMVVWALKHRLYVVAAISMVYSIVYNALVVQLNPSSQLYLWLAQVVIFGFLASHLHRWLLERRGWVCTEREIKYSGKDSS